MPDNAAGSKAPAPRQVALGGAGAGAGVAVGVAIVSGVVGMTVVGTKWSWLMFVGGSAVTGYLLAGKYPAMGGALMGVGFATGLISLISWAGTVLATTGIPSRTGITRVVEAAGALPSMLLPARSALPALPAPRA